MSNLVYCPNCGHEFPLVKTYSDKLGLHTVCPECGSSFDTNEEVELSDSQIERNDEIYEAVFNLCKILTENNDLNWNMSFIGEIADYAAHSLVAAGNKVRFPAVVIKQDCSQYIEEYYESK